MTSVWNGLQNISFHKQQIRILFWVHTKLQNPVQGYTKDFIEK